MISPMAFIISLAACHRSSRPLGRGSTPHHKPLPRLTAIARPRDIRAARRHHYRGAGPHRHRDDRRVSSRVEARRLPGLSVITAAHESSSRPVNVRVDLARLARVVCDGGHGAARNTLDQAPGSAAIPADEEPRLRARQERPVALRTRREREDIREAARTQLLRLPGLRRDPIEPLLSRDVSTV